MVDEGNQSIYVIVLPDYANRYRKHLEDKRHTLHSFLSTRVGFKGVEHFGVERTLVFMFESRTALDTRPHLSILNALRSNSLKQQGFLKTHNNHHQQ